MLDTDTPTATADDSTVPPAAPRRRRSASRPAGPPAQVTLPPAVETEPTEDAERVASEPVDAVTPEPVADEAAAEVVDPEQAADQLDADAETEQEAAETEQEVVEIDAEAETDAEAQQADADIEQADAEAEQEAADELADVVAEEQVTGELVETAPAAVEAEVDPASAETEPEGAQAESEALGSEPEEARAEPVERPARRRRSRATVTEVVVESAEPETTQEPLSLDELPTLDDLAPRASEPRGRRRRRAAEPKPEATEAQPGEADEDEPDPLAESLEELTRSGGRKRARVKAAEDERAEALDQLAAAIGGQLGEDADEPGDAASVTIVLDDASDEPTSDDAASDDADDADGEGPRRRRRRRGGRRRRRGGAADAGDDDGADDGAGDEDAAADAADADSEGDGASDPAADEAEGTPSTRRRRRRRRRGEDTAGAEDDPSDVVVRVREPRRTKANDQVTGIDGSTRMEAKRQRRREGRAAGRRRSPILSEAEFLARRESVDRKMLIRQAERYTQIAVLEDGVLVEHYVDQKSAISMIGNVYLGKVQNVLPSMEAAFIDIGRGRNAVLYAGEVDWDAFGVTGGDRKIEKVLKSGQSVLVQVSKDPIGAKGARLTAHVSIPGRYVVYSPSGQLSGISRKLPEGERSRLKGILDELVGDAASVIVRTAAEGASEDELVRDVNRLKAQWEVIEKRVKAGKSPELLYAEPDLTVRIVRDLFTEDFGRLIVDGNGVGEDSWDTVDAYVSHVAPHLKERLTHWDRAESGDLFAAHRVDEQIAKALERKVFLPSGGSLVIDRTEAMTVIDVNTGKFTGTSGNLEATVTSNNLEAAEEIVRQLRLRDIGGIIVIDFIDMVLPANRELLLRRLVECLGRDRTRHQVAEVTSLGLVQMTRKRIGTGLAEAFTVTCETCHGRGYHRHDTPVESQTPADGGEREHGRRRR